MESRFKMGEWVIFGDLRGQLIGGREDMGHYYWDLEWDSERYPIESIPEEYIDRESDVMAEEMENFANKEVKIEKVNIMPKKLNWEG